MLLLAHDLFTAFWFRAGHTLALNARDGSVSSGKNSVSVNEGITPGVARATVRLADPLL